MDQLAAVVDSLAPFLRRVKPFEWSQAEGLTFFDSWHLLRRGVFATTILPAFSSHLSSLGDKESIVVVAYSLGGYLVYRWLEDLEPGGHPAVRLVVTVAGLWRCSEGAVDIEARGRPLSLKGIKEPAVDLDRCLAHFAWPPGRRRLHAITSAGDIAATHKDAFMPVEKLDVECCVEQLQVSESSHEDICRDQRVLRYVRGVLGAM